MPRLLFLSAARQDLADIARYIARESRSRDTAKAFTDRLISQCERLATYASAVGRSRPELRPDYRSVTFGSYVIFFRYRGVTAQEREVMEIIHIVHGSRDLDAWFSALPDDRKPAPPP